MKDAGCPAARPNRSLAPRAAGASATPDRPPPVIESEGVGGVVCLAQRFFCAGALEVYPLPLARVVGPCFTH
jgi:hypothetical protein